MDPYSNYQTEGSGARLYRCVITMYHGNIRGPLLNAPHHPEELCGAPLDAAQHPEELCTIDSLDIFLEHRLLIDMNYSHILHGCSTTARARAPRAHGRCLATD